MFVDPMLAEVAKSRHQHLVREGEISRTFKRTASEGYSPRERGALALAGYLLSLGQTLKARYQPATE